MEFNEIEKMVKKQISIPDEFTLTQNKCYMSLKFLYHLFRNGLIEKDQAIADKQRIKQLYISETDSDEKKQSVLQEQHNRILKSELLRTEMMKSDNCFEILDYAIQCIGIMLGDDGCFHRMMSERIKVLSNG